MSVRGEGRTREKGKAAYEPPLVTPLGTVVELTLLNQSGPNFDFQLNIGSV